MNREECLAEAVVLDPGNDAAWRKWLHRVKIQNRKLGKDAPAWLIKTVELAEQGRTLSESKRRELVKEMEKVLAGEGVLPGTPAPADPPAEPVCSTADLIAADPSILEDFIGEARERLELVEAQLLRLESAPGDQETLNALFRAFHSIKGTANFLGLNEIKQLAHQAETLLQRARNGEIRLTDQWADLALEAADTLEQMTTQLRPLKNGESPSLPGNYSSLLSRLESRDAAPTSNLHGVKSESVSARAGVEDAFEGRIRVSLSRLDNLMESVSQLVVVHAMLAQDETAQAHRSARLSRNVSQLGKIVRQLQDLSMSLRMVPLRSLFYRLERAARDLARESKKQIRFEISGEETEIDRNVVEALHDPLVHLLRNAVDHGIEEEAVRLEAGKPAEGHIVLRAFHTSGQVIIEIQDDGRGLDRKKILRRAVEKGWITPDSQPDENELIKFIFQPGFSTKETVTEVSGRGVGLDVVKRNLEKLHGWIEVDSRLEAGCRFALRIPLTLAVLDGLLLQTGGQQYLIPTLHVRHAFRPSSGEVSTVQGRGEVVFHQGHFVPVVRLHRMFGIPDAQTDPTKALLLVVEEDSRQGALLADGLLGQQQVVIKTLGDGLGEINGVAGAAILGDGRIRLILDVSSLLELALGNAGVALEGSGAAA